jgi:glyoxylase-like metal-dependent hydrolase (beta-lactamase superfamily II)
VAEHQRAGGSVVVTEIIHLNAGTLVAPGYPIVVCHCLALRDGESVALVDSGIGLLDAADPERRLGRELIEQAGFQFNEHDTAARRLEAIGVSRERVRDIVLTHADPDHTGGLADFPEAEVHLAEEELRELQAEQPRYVQTHVAHEPRWRTYRASENRQEWFGLPARRLDVPLSSAALLVELPGHTLGHCGVAVERSSGWLLHVGDAYYLRAELERPDHPVDQLASAAAEDDALRRRSLEHLRRLAREHADEVTMCGYHDLEELPRGCLDPEHGV